MGGDGERRGGGSGAARGAAASAAALVCGPGLLFAALIGMLGAARMDAARELGWGGVFPGLLAGAALAGVAACAASALLARRASRGSAAGEAVGNGGGSEGQGEQRGEAGGQRGETASLALGGLLAAAGCLACLLGEAGFLAGASLGAGTALLALGWADVFAELPFLEAFRRVAWALFAGALAYSGAAIAAMSAGFGPWMPALALAETAASCACLATAERWAGGLGAARCGDGGEGPAGRAAPESGGCGKYRRAGDEGLAGAAATEAASGGAGLLAGPLKSRLLSVAGAVWAPAVGLAICVFLFGLLWNQPAPVKAGAASAAASLSFAMPLAATLALALAGRRARDYAAVKRLVWTVVPIVAALFLITPNFDNLGVPAWNALVEGLQNTGSCAEMLCAFALVLRACRASDVSVPGATGACVALVSASGLAGLAVHGAVQQGGNVVAVVLFVLYVCATVAFLAIRGAGDRDAHAQESGAFEAYLRPRCERLAASGGLTQRESEVLRLLARGHSYAFIAELLYVSEATVRTHARNLYRKLGVSGQEGLINLVDGM